MLASLKSVVRWVHGNRWTIAITVVFVMASLASRLLADVSKT